MFKKLQAALGKGGAKVDTVLDNPTVYPGGVLTGRVDVRGGEIEQQLEGIRAAISAVVEVESGDDEWSSARLIGEQRISGPFAVSPGQHASLPFQLQVPIELSPNLVGSQHIHGLKIAVATVLEIDNAVDARDNDPIRVQALPAQEAVLYSMQQLNFHFKSADFEAGRVPGSTLGFYGEYEFDARSSGRRFKEVELTFLTRAHDLDVLIEVDKKGGFFLEGSDVTRRFTLNHQDTDVQSITQHINHVLGTV
ncbi:sporulation protein [Nocardioides litoris]|uniref:sporulation protein n=1 Tax=Nocardioides litoris TaxID=1926648 RepID=UPI001476C245|nr:sporulation protein [Nocardioides litoris]